jgi:autotransporter-associated beta strand protein/YD repeat-containing protein
VIQGGYTLSGNALTLGGNLTTEIGSGPVTVALPLSLGAASRVVTIADDLAHTFDLIISSPIGGSPGVGLTKNGPGTLVFASANTYSGATTIGSGVLRLAAAGALSDVAPVTLNSGATLDLNGVSESIGSLVGSGALLLTGALTTGGDGTTTTFSGPMSGDGALTKVGAGTMTLSGNSLGYTGAITVSAGTLLANGNISNADVTVATGATLGGTGTLSDLSAGGTIAPGNSPGRLNSTGNVSWGATGTFAVEINGLTPGTQYDQLVAAGTVALGGATLAATMASFDPPVGTTFTIVASAGGVAGTFAGLPDLSRLTIGGRAFEIDYTANAVILTRVNAALHHFTVEAAGGGPVADQTAGTAFGVRITARDASDAIVETFAGMVTITSPNATLSGTPVMSGAFTGGVLDSQSLQITSAQPGTLLAVVNTAGAEQGSSNAFRVGDAGVSTFVVEANGGGDIPDQRAGTPFTIRITAFDAFDNRADSFTGAVDLTSTGALVGAPVTTGAFSNGAVSQEVSIATVQNDVTITASRAGGGATGVSNAFDVRPRRATSDFNGDGFCDLLWRNRETGKAEIWFMHGAGVIGVHQVPQPLGAPAEDWAIQSCADLDADTDPDIVLISQKADQVVAVMMQDEHIDSIRILGEHGAALAFAGAGDVDGDGDDDLLWRNLNNGNTRLWRMQGGAVEGRETLPARSHQWSLVGFGDLDGDRDADLLWRGPGGGFEIWLSDPAHPDNPVVMPAAIAGEGQAGAPLAAHRAWDGVGTEAGRTLFHNRTSGRFLVWTYDGDGRFTERFVTADGSTAPLVAGEKWTFAGACDLDGDGVLDLILRNHERPALRFVLSNHGDQTTVTRGPGEMGPAQPSRVKSWELIVGR